MKKSLLILSVLLLNLYSKEHFAKAEPINTYILQARVAGEVIFSNEKLEGTILGRKSFLRIDDRIDRRELALLKNKESSLKSSLVLNKSVNKNYQIIIDKKQKNYDQIKNLKIKSDVEKDKEFFDLANTKIQLLSSKDKVESIKIQLSDTALRLYTLNRNINDKRVAANKMLLIELKVKKGEVVGVGTPLAEVADLTKAKLTLYLSQDEIKTLKNKTLYINEKKSSYTVNKIWPVTDKEYISAYRSEIIIDAPETFSQLMKIEFRR